MLTTTAIIARIAGASTLYDVLGVNRNDPQTLTRVKLDSGKRRAIMALHSDNRLNTLDAGALDERALVNFAHHVLVRRKSRLKYNMLMDLDYGRNRLQVIGHTSAGMENLTRRIMAMTLPGSLMTLPTRAARSIGRRAVNRELDNAGRILCDLIDKDPKLTY